jgi:phosphoribosylformylglycinamidine cyclo-ligase
MADKGKGLTYKDSGVDVEAGQSFIRSIRSLVEDTHGREVLSRWGSFSGLFRPRLSEYSKPVLASSTDGVGTKLKIAFAMDRHHTVGIDLVAMCVNDLACQGAEPLFFLDYLATGRLRSETAVEIVRGITRGCREACCALMGGETAELPGFYAEGEYDLAGFAVGIVEEERIIDGSSVAEGDLLLGLPSSGLHSNGFSLARKVLLETAALPLHRPAAPMKIPLGEELLKPTRIYSGLITRLLAHHPVNGIAHITGGGIPENLGRVIPDGLTARVDKSALPSLPIFETIRNLGGIEEMEMFRTFNMGVGMILVVPGGAAAQITSTLNGEGERVLALGEVVKDTGEGKVVIV